MYRTHPVECFDTNISLKSARFVRRVVRPTGRSVKKPRNLYIRITNIASCARTITFTIGCVFYVALQCNIMMNARSKRRTRGVVAMHFVRPIDAQTRTFYGTIYTWETRGSRVIEYICALCPLPAPSVPDIFWVPYVNRTNMRHPDPSCVAFCVSPIHRRWTGTHMRAMSVCKHARRWGRHITKQSHLIFRHHHRQWGRVCVLETIEAILRAEASAYKTQARVTHKDHPDDDDGCDRDD